MASPMVTCPTCQAMLRLPPGSDIVRCPRCKTVLAIEGLPPPPPPVPVPPPAVPLPPPRPAIPLPFDRPATPDRPADPLPAADPFDAPPAAAPRKRAKLVEDEDPVEEQQRRLRVEEARKAAEEEERDERRMERLAAECKPARYGVQALAGGAGFYAAALTLSFLYATAYVVGFTALLTPLLYLAAVCGAVNWLLSVAGLGMCLGGPRAVRPMAASALIFAVAHVVLFGIQLARTLSQFGTVSQAAELDTFKMLLTFDILGSVSNLNVLTDFPGNLAVGYDIAWLGTAGGVLELTRLMMIGMVCQHYAAEGKDTELGYQSLRFIVRVFLALIAVAGVKLAMKLAFSTAAYDTGWMKVGAAMVSLSSAGLFLTLAVCVGAQVRVMLDTAEIVTARRFGLKRWQAVGV